MVRQSGDEKPRQYVRLGAEHIAFRHGEEAQRRGYLLRPVAHSAGNGAVCASPAAPIVAGTENSGYVIALVGVVIWYVAAPWKRSRWDVALMVYALIGCSFAHSDLFPHSLRDNIIRPYALKALPIAIIWFNAFNIWV